MGSIGLENGNCQAATPANPGIQYTNTLKSNKVNIMNFTLFPQILTSQLSVVINLVTSPSPFATTFPNGSITAALRRGNSPNADQFDFSGSYLSGSPLQFAISDPFPGDWYLAVTNNLQITVSWTVVFTNTSCKAGTVGPSCNSTLTDLTNILNATNMIGTGDYQYFIVKNTTELIVGVGTADLEEIAPTLLVSLFNWPTNQSALVASKGQKVNYIFASNNLNITTWNIAVWAYEGQEYLIWANVHCANNCSGKYGSGENYGTCNTYNGLCQCNKHYGGLTCTRTGLAVVWIVLIVIACAIILAIAVGVPVACYLRNRNRTRYERV